MPIEIFFIFGIFTLILGYVIGNFLPMLKQKSTSQIDNDTNMEVDANPMDTQTEAERAVPATATPGLLDVAHLWRHEESKQMVAQIENQYINHGDDLTSDQHALLSLALLDLGDWVGLESRMQAVEDLQVENENELEDKTAPAFFSPIDMLKKAVTSDVFLPLAETSLAEQIDPILQSLLDESPLRGRGISLMDIEGRGMVVNVGLDMYDAVGDVPDEEIRTLIQKAVAVWERRATGDE